MTQELQMNRRRSDRGIEVPEHVQVDGIVRRIESAPPGEVKLRVPEKDLNLALDRARGWTLTDVVRVLGGIEAVRLDDRRVVKSREFDPGETWNFSGGKGFPVYVQRMLKQRDDDRLRDIDFDEDLGDFLKICLDRAARTSHFEHGTPDLSGSFETLMKDLIRNLRHCWDSIFGERGGVNRRELTSALYPAVTGFLLPKNEELGENAAAMAAAWTDLLTDEIANNANCRMRPIRRGHVSG